MGSPSQKYFSGITDKEIAVYIGNIGLGLNTVQYGITLNDIHVTGSCAGLSRLSITVGNIAGYGIPVMDAITVYAGNFPDNISYGHYAIDGATAAQTYAISKLPMECQLYLVATGLMIYIAAGQSMITENACAKIGDCIIGVYDSTVEFASNITDGVSNIVNLFEVAEKSTEKIYDGYGDGIEVTTYEIRLSESGIQMFDNIVNGVNDFVAQMNELTSVIPDNADLANNEQLQERIKGALGRYGISEDEAQKIIDSPNMFSDNFALGDLFEKALNCISSVAYAAADIDVKTSNDSYLNEGLDCTNTFKDAWNTIMYWGDPLALDLNGDGIAMTSTTENYVQFDLDCDGRKERIGWVNTSDGFLAQAA